MNIFSDYDARVFESLPDFRSAKQSLSMNKEHLKELGRVICRYGLQEHVGVSLLHKHFYLSPDERLVKDFIGNGAYIKPSTKHDINEVIPYLWKFDKVQTLEDANCYPLEFVAISSRTEGARVDAGMLSNVKEFLKEMATKLYTFGIENTFGISILHGISEINLGADEILLETTDYTNRILNLSPATRAQINPIEDTETAWQFTSISSGKLLLNCQNYCTKYCNDTNH